MVACSGPMRGRRADRLNLRTAPSGSVPGILGSFGASGTEPRCSLSSALGSSGVAQTFSRASTIGQMYSAGSIANRKWGAWVRGVLPGAAAALRTGSGIPPPLGQELAYAACPRLPLACDRSVSRVVLGGSETPRRGLLWRGLWRGHGESPAMAARASTTSEAQCGGEGSGGKPPHRFPKPTPRRRRRIVADAADQGARRLARDSGR